MSLTRFVTDRLAIEGVSALLTGNQTLKKISGASQTSSSVALILMQLFLNCFPQIGINNGGHWNRDPLLDRGVVV
jgi:hypothetical protein